MKLLKLCIVVWLMSTAALAQVPMTDVMVLIVGPTTNPTAPAEKQVVARLTKLRKEAQFKQLKMATMHYDRPREAEYAKGVLGIQKSDLVCVAIVALDPVTHQPVKTLYSWVRMDGPRLDEAESSIRQWAAQAGLVPGGTPGPGPRPIGSPSPGPYIQPTPRPQPTGPNYSQEGRLTIARQADNLAQNLWNRQKGAPIREDQLDLPTRQALLTLAESTRRLRLQFEGNQINPKEQLRETLVNRDAFLATHPELYLEPSLRGELPGLVKQLDQLEVIYYQLNPGLRP